MSSLIRDNLFGGEAIMPTPFNIVFILQYSAFPTSS